MNEAKKKKRSFAIVIMMIVMAAALCMTMISCGSDSNAPDDESKVKTEQSADTEKKADEKTEKTDAKTEAGSNSANKNSNSSKETQKSTAATQTKQVCYISIEGYCSGMEINLQGGDTVYSILCRTGAAVSGSGNYIKGINGKFEFDEGPTSGWMYYVNGSKPNVSCGSYSVKAGDSITWDYVSSF